MAHPVYRNILFKDRNIIYSLKVNQCIITDFSATPITDVIISEYSLFFSNNTYTDSLLAVMIFC